MGWHADDEPIFQAAVQDALIMSLSLGATRAFELRPRHSDLTDGVRVLLHDGDLCAMEGLCQKHYRHCVPLQEDEFNNRINLTWRYIVRHQPHCPKYVTSEEASEEHRPPGAGDEDSEVELGSAS